MTVVASTKTSSSRQLFFIMVFIAATIVVASTTILLRQQRPSDDPLPTHSDDSRAQHQQQQQQQQHIPHTVSLMIKTGRTAMSILNASLASTPPTPQIRIVSDSPAVLRLDDGRTWTIEDVLVGSEAYMKDDERAWLSGIRAGVSVTTSVESLDRRMGWSMDRYKFVPLVLGPLSRAPTTDWTMIIDDDTHVFWSTFATVVEGLDPSGQHYMGSPAWGGSGTYFAHGGSGILLSRGAMQALHERSVDGMGICQMLARLNTCGDATLAHCINQLTGVRLNRDRGGEWFDANLLEVGRAWGLHDACVVVGTLHHVSVEEFRRLRELEADVVAAARYVRRRDIFERFVVPRLGAGAMAADVSYVPSAGDGIMTRNATSAKECMVVCKVHESCLAWQFQEAACVISHRVAVASAKSGVVSGHVVELRLQTLPPCPAPPPTRP